MAHENAKSFEFDGKETLIPTVLDGKQLTDDEAVAAFRAGKIESLGEFASPEEATAFAKARSDASNGGLRDPAPTPDPAQVAPPFDDDVDRDWTRGKAFSSPAAQRALTARKPEQFERVEEVRDPDLPQIRRYGVFNGNSASILLGTEPLPEEPPGGPQAAEGTEGGGEPPEGADGEPGAFLGDVGKALGDLEQGLLDVPGGLTTGVGRFGAQTLAFLGLIDQDDADEFERMLDFFQPKDPGHAIVAGIADVGGQFVLPAVGGIKLLRAAGAAPVVATLAADALVGAVGVSPGEETLANLIPEDSEAFGALRELLAKDPDDPDWINRSREAVNAMVAIGLGEAALRGAPKAAKGIGKITKAAAEAFVSAIGAAQKIAKKVAASPKAQEIGRFFERFGRKEIGGMPITRPAQAEIIEQAGPQPAHRMTIDELDVLLTEAKLSDDEKLLKALGSKKRVKMFKQLDRSRNSQISSQADEASRKFDDEFGDLTDEQERLIFGIGETNLQVDEIREIRTARLNIDSLVDDADVQVAQEIATGMRAVEPTDIRALVERGSGPGSVQANFVRIEGGFAELKRRGLNNNAIDDLILDAMETFGFSRPDATEVLSKFAALGAIGLTEEPEEEGTGEIKTADIASKLLRQILRGPRRAGPPVPPVAGAGEMLERAGNVVTIRQATQQEATDFAARYGTKEANVGIDFNFDNIHGADDMRRALNETSEAFTSQIDEAKRGVIKLEATKDLAEQLDMVPEVLTRRVGETFNAEKMVAARMMLAQSGRRLDELAKTASTPLANDFDLLAFRRQLSLHAAIQMQVKAAQTEIARALSSFRIPVGDETIRNRRVDELLREFGGRSHTKQLAEAYLKIEDPVQRGKFAFRAWGTKLKAAWFEMWVNGLLSGARTHVRNTVGNTMFQAWSIPEHLIAAAIGKGRSLVTGSADRVYGGEVIARIYGMVQGTRDGLVLAAKAFRSGTPSDPMGKIESMKYRSISAEAFNISGPFGKGVDYLGTVIRMSGRFLMAEDEFFKATAGRAELYGLAYRRAMQSAKQGATRDQAVDLLVNEVRNPPPDLALSVQDAARYYTFTNELGQAGKWVQGAQRFAVGRIILPFVRTPLNIMKAFASRNPLTAPLMSGVRKEIAAGGAARDLAIARIGLGSAVMGYAASLAMDGRITGTGPQDFGERRMLRETGWQPYSVVFEKDEGLIDDAVLATLRGLGVVSEDDDKIYISIAGLEPVGLLFGVAADAVGLMKWQPDAEGRESIALAAVLALSENMKNRSFFEGVANAVEALEEGPRAANRWLSRFAGGINPMSALVRTTEQIMDPVRRDVRVDPDLPVGVQQFYTALNGWRAATPGLSKDLPPVRNIFGEEVRIGQGRWWEAINPFYISVAKYSPVEKELLRLGVPFDLPQRVIDGVALNPEEYSRYVELQGKDIILDGLPQKEALLALIEAPDYALMTEQEHIDAVRNLHRDYLDEAKELMDLEFPALASKIETRRVMEELGIQP